MVINGEDLVLIHGEIVSALQERSQDDVILRSEPERGAAQFDCLHRVLGLEEMSLRVPGGAVEIVLISQHF